MDDNRSVIKPFVPPIGAKKRMGVNYQKLAKTAQEKLRHLSFDPIEEMVGQYEHLVQEVERQNYIRDNRHDPELVPEYLALKYSPRLHMEMVSHLTNITKELLRYGYARVSETNELITNVPPMLQIQLTKKGETFNIGAAPTEADGETPEASKDRGMNDDW